MRARGGSAIESGKPGRGGRRLWTGETQEGIDASGPFGDSSAARARAGKEALKPLTSARSPWGRGESTGGTARGQGSRKGNPSTRGERLEG